jgi:adenylate kinase family enzyme
MARVRRLLVIGPGGAGKSTLARRLGTATGIPVVHLDAHFWRPGWVEPADAAWEQQVEALLGGDAWIMDGNYGRTMERRLARADGVVLLDPPRLVCVARAVRRWWAYRGRSRPDMTAGCPERVTREFVVWIWTYRRRRLPGVLAMLEGFRAQGGRVWHARSAGEAERAITEIVAAQESGDSDPRV